MTEQLFNVYLKHAKTGEKIALQVWGTNVEEATHKLNVLFDAHGEYRWTGSGPKYGGDGKVIRREANTKEEITP